MSNNDVSRLMSVDTATPLGGCRTTVLLTCFCWFAPMVGWLFACSFGVIVSASGFASVSMCASMWCVCVCVCVCGICACMCVCVLCCICMCVCVCVCVVCVCCACVVYIYVWFLCMLVCGGLSVCVSE